MEKKMGQKNGQEKRQKTKAEYKNISREELMQEISGQENARTEEEKEARKNAYHAYVSQVTPSYSLTLNMLKAFLVGGIICCIGQGIMNFAMSRGLDQMNAGKWTSVILVLISVILTGLNIYPTIAKFGGAGALVPITGFANGVAAPAIEFKKEGQVFGIGSQIFSIGGPVILYGIFTSCCWDWCIGSGNWHREIVLDFLSEIYYYAKGVIINRNVGEIMWKAIFLGQKK